MGRHPPAGGFKTMWAHGKMGDARLSHQAHDACWLSCLETASDRRPPSSLFDDGVLESRHRLPCSAPDKRRREP